MKSIYDSHYKFCRQVFQVCGLWVNQKSSFYSVYRAVQAIIPISMCHGQISYYLKLTDLDYAKFCFQAVWMLACFFTSVLLLSFVIFDNRMLIIVEAIEDLFQSTINEHRKIIINRVQLCEKIMNRIFYSLGVFATIFVIYTPVAIWYKCLDDEIDRDDCINRVSLCQSIYGFSQGFILWTTTVAFALTYCVDGCFLYLASFFYLLTLEQIVVFELKHCHINQSDKGRHFFRVAKLCTNYQQMMKNFSDTFNSMTSLITTIGGLIRVTEIALILYSVENVSQASFIVSLLPLVIVGITGPLAVCSGGERVCSISDNIKNSIYDELQWTKLKNMRQTLNILQMSWSNPLTINFMGLIYYDLEMFIKILKSSFTYFTFLRTMES